MNSKRTPSGEPEGLQERKAVELQRPGDGAAGAPAPGGPEDGGMGKPRRGELDKPRPVGARKHEWIATQLRRVYDEALQEAIPPEMLALLDQLDKDSDTPKEPEGPA